MEFKLRWSSKTSTLKEQNSKWYKTFSINVYTMTFLFFSTQTAWTLFANPGSWDQDQFFLADLKPPCPLVMSIMFFRKNTLHHLYCLVKIVKILEWHGVGGGRWRVTQTSASFPCWLLVMNTWCDDSSQHRTSDINWCNKHSVKFKPLQILTQLNFWRMTPSLKLCVLLRLVVGGKLSFP